VRPLTVPDLLGRRLANQRLAGGLHKSPAEAVASLGAVQSQDYPGAKWAVGQRVRGGTDAGVEDAFNRGEIVRLHVLRPTWHFVAPRDLRWMVALSGPRVRRVLATYDRKLDLDERVLPRCFRIIERALRDRNYKTRVELAAALAAGGIAAAGQKLAHIAGHAELTGLICSGPQRGRQSTYALVDERVPPAPVMSRDESIAELASRYFASHGPATVRDFVWWSGLTVGEARRGLEMVGAASISSGSLTCWHVPSRRTPVEPAGLVHLLPNYDEYLVAYQDREAVGAAEFKTLVAEQRVDLFGYHLIVDGAVAGSWRRAVGARGVAVRVDLHKPQPTGARQAIAAAAGRFGAFLSLNATVEYVARSARTTAKIRRKIS
jgi:hypothetical protein